MDKEKLQKFLVYGEITIPVIFPIRAVSKEIAFDKVSLMIDNSSVLDGEIHTTDGRSHVLIAPKCRFMWQEALAEGEA